MSPRALLRLPDFRILWLARAISFLGDSMALVGLLLHLESAAGSALAVSLLLVAGDCVPGLLAPITGAIADRLPVKATLVGCELVQAALVLALAALPPLPILLGLAATLGVMAGIVGPAARRAVPLVVSDSDLERANSFIGVGTYGIEAIGPVVAAGLLLITDVKGLLVVDAVTFVASALLLTRFTVSSTPSRGEEHLLSQARAGLGHVWRTPLLRQVAVGFLIVVSFTAVDDVALVFLAKDELGTTDATASLLYAGAGIGILLGFLALARFGSRWAALPVLIAGLAVSSLGNLLTGLAWAAAAALAFQTMRGLGIAAIDLGLTLHVQRTVPGNLQGRTFGILYGGAGLAAGIAYLLGGLLLHQTDARITFMVAGTGGLLATMVTAVTLRRAAQRDS